MARWACAFVAHGSVTSSAFSVAKKLSETAVSQQCSLRIMLATLPSAPRTLWKSSQAYWAAIGVKHRSGSRGLPVTGIAQRIEHELIGHALREVVAKHMAGLQGNDHCRVQPAVASRDVRNAARPGRYGCIDVKRVCAGRSGRSRRWGLSVVARGYGGRLLGPREVEFCTRPCQTGAHGSKTLRHSTSASAHLRHVNLDTAPLGGRPATSGTPRVCEPIAPQTRHPGS